MAWGDASNPVRFGQGQHVSDERHLFLKQFGGEVLTAYDSAVLTLDKHEVKDVPNGMKSAQFPKVWKATSEYHTPGQEMLGNDIDSTEIVITLDDILVSHTAISDLDNMLSHFDVSSKYAKAMGHELAKAYDKNVFRSIVGAARSAADGPFPGGAIDTDATLINTGAIDGNNWVEAIKRGNATFFANDVPEDEPRFLAVNWAVFNAIKYAKDAGGNFLVLNRDFNDQSNGGGVQRRASMLEIDGVYVYPTKHLPSTDESADPTVYSKYQGNYSTTTGVMWHPMAVGTAKMMDLKFETTRDVRRLENFLVAQMFCGHGPLRPECAIEMRTAVPV